MTPGKVTAANIQRMYMPWRDRKLAPKTQRQYNGALRRLLRWLMVPERLVATIPRIKKVNPRGVIVGLDVYEQVLKASPPHLRLCLLLCGDTALRLGTAVRIAAEDWDAEGKRLTFTTKANQVVSLPVTERLERLINEAMAYGPAEPGTPLVTRLGGPETRWAGHSYSRQLKAIIAELKVQPFTSHDLRRSAARRLYGQTKDLRLAQHLLGHTNLASTFHYLYPHLAEVTREQLTEATGGKDAEE